MPMRASGAIYEFPPAMQDGFVAAEKNNANMNILVNMYKYELMLGLELGLWLGLVSETVSGSGSI